MTSTSGSVTYLSTPRRVGRGYNRHSSLGGITRVRTFNGLLKQFRQFGKFNSERYTLEGSVAEPVLFLVGAEAGVKVRLRLHLR